MENKNALIFPGQGAQYVGMGKDFFEEFPLAKETFQQAEDHLEMKLSDILFQGPEEELKKTINSQLGIFINSVAIFRVLKSIYPQLNIDTCGGLSLGEYSALFASGRIAFQDGLTLVKHRATFMTESCASHPGTMAAVLGLPGEVVESIVNELQKEEKIWAANFNTPGQVVISGTKEGVTKALEALKEKGAKRVVPLQVEGAFHSGLMIDAQEKLTPYIDELILQEGSARLVMNVTGDYVSNAEEIKNNLVLQVTNSTRWEESIQNMAKEGITSFIELGCGKTLSGMNKKIVPDKRSVSIDTVEDLRQLEELL